MLPYFLYAALALNVITFFAFGLDKRKARLGQSRTSEKALITFSWAMGFVGGWIAMSVFRHKTQKRSFQVKMVLATVFNLAWLPIWLYFRG